MRVIAAQMVLDKQCVVVLWISPVLRPQPVPGGQYRPNLLSLVGDF